MATSVIPTPAPVVTLPSGTIQESATDRATREARERIAQGQPAVVTHPSQAQVRRADGTFGAPLPTDRVAEVGGGAVAAAPGAGQAAPAADAPVADGGAAPGATAAPTGAEGAESAEEVAAAETPEQVAERERDERTVTLIGRNDQEYLLELPAGTPREVVDTVRALRNGFMRGEEVRSASEQIMARADAIAQTRAEIELDPVGYLLGVAEESPVVELSDGSEVHLVDHLVLNLLTQPEVFARLKERVELLLDDEKELRTVRAETTAQRLQIRGEMAVIAEERAVVTRNLEDVQATVGSLLPTAMSEGQQRVLYADCLRDLKEHAERNRMLTIPVRDIPAILAQRLTAYGINPVEAATRIAESAARRGAAVARRPAPGATRSEPTAAPGAAAALPNGQRFVASARKKGEAGAIPPGGAGSPAGASGLTAPRKADGSKMGVEETIAWHRAQIQKGVRRT